MRSYLRSDENITDQPVTLEVGERIVQGVFMPFLIVDGDEADGVRTGGFWIDWTVEEAKWQIIC